MSPLIILIALLYNYAILKKPSLKKLGFNDYPAFYNLLLNYLGWDPNYKYSSSFLGFSLGATWVCLAFCLRLRGV